jgi:putative ABC transport system permease protein
MPFSAANIGIQGGMRVEGQPAPPPSELPSTYLTVTTTDYFRAMQIPLRRGRLFSDADHANGSPVGLVNDVMALRFWPDGDPVGQRVTANWQGRWRTMQIVGVVGSLRHEGLDRSARPELFMPLAQVPFGSMTFVVRTADNPATLMPTLKSRIWMVDPTLPFYDTATVDALVSESLAPRRFMMSVLTTLALLAFGLAAAGMYGVLSFLTAQRTREIGVRIAMGARSADILRLVLGEGLAMVAVGIVLGLGGTFAATRLLTAFRYGIPPIEGATIVATVMAFVAVAAVACGVPARRAARVDPMIALRCE